MQTNPAPTIHIGIPSAVMHRLRPMADAAESIHAQLRGLNNQIDARRTRLEKLRATLDSQCRSADHFESTYNFGGELRYPEEAAAARKNVEEVEREVEAERASIGINAARAIALAEQLHSVRWPIEQVLRRYGVTADVAGLDFRPAGGSAEVIRI